MVRLSVNLNKVATLRNARTTQPEDGSAGSPSVVEAARICIEAGALGLTVHPRADRRHITPTDVREVAAVLAPLRDRVEFNLEGDLRADFIALAHEVRPHQLTLVPVRPGEITSEAGWSADTDRAALRKVIAQAQAAGMRVSVFVDPEDSAVDLAADVGADRVELYTEPYARAHDRGDGAASFAHYARAAARAHAHGLGINAGHDLDLHNLPRFRGLPHLDEVSIGHALMTDALWIGLPRAVRAYLDALGD